MRSLLLPSACVAGLALSSSAQTTLAEVHGTMGTSVSGNGSGLVAAFVGDVNADGRADWIVGISKDDTLDSNAGMVRVHSGADGSVLMSITGSGYGANFGAAVDGVGDVNADGVGDFIVGVDSVLSTTGSAFVHSGADGTCCSRSRSCRPR